MRSDANCLNFCPSTWFSVAPASPWNSFLPGAGCWTTLPSSSMVTVAPVLCLRVYAPVELISTVVPLCCVSRRSPCSAVAPYCDPECLNTPMITGLDRDPEMNPTYTWSPSTSFAGVCSVTSAPVVLVEPSRNDVDGRSVLSSPSSTPLICDSCRHPGNG